MNTDPATMLRWLVRLVAIGLAVTIAGKAMERLTGPLPWS